MTPLKQLLISVDLMMPSDEHWTNEDFKREFEIMLHEHYYSHREYPIKVRVHEGEFAAEVEDWLT